MEEQRDARTLSDRELLLSIHQSVTGITHDLYGNGSPGLIKEFEVVKTQVAERTTSKAQVLGISGVFSAGLIIIGEYLKKHLGVE